MHVCRVREGGGFVQENTVIRQQYVDVYLIALLDIDVEVYLHS